MHSLRSNRRFRVVLVTVLLGGLLITLTGCDVLLHYMLPAGVAGMGGAESGDTGATDPLAPEPDDGSGDDISLVAIACPTEPTDFLLTLVHDWTFSPAGQTQVMQVTGTTSSGASCMVTVHREHVQAPDCLIPYSITGNMAAGQCDISGESTALISMTGSCADGVITLTITEVQNADAGLGGALNCPYVSEAYVTFYPPSITTRSFIIQDLGETQSEDGGDMAGFDYHKHWTLTPLS